MVFPSCCRCGVVAPLIQLRCLKRRESRPPTRWLLVPVSSRCWRGVLLVVGAYTLAAALLLAATTAASSWMFHLSNGFFLNWSLEAGVGHGYEFDFLRLSALVCVMLSGPGAIAYDARRTREKGSRRNQKKT